MCGDGVCGNYIGEAEAVDCSGEGFVTNDDHVFLFEIIGMIMIKHKFILVMARGWPAIGQSRLNSVSCCGDVVEM